MSRPFELRWAVLVMWLAGLSVPAWAGEDSRTALAFVEQLREHEHVGERLDYLQDPGRRSRPAGEYQGRFSTTKRAAR